MRGKTSASLVFLRLGLAAALLVTACVGVDEGDPNADRE
jgi:hypothetical protein